MRFADKFDFFLVLETKHEEEEEEVLVQDYHFKLRFLVT